MTDFLTLWSRRDETFRRVVRSDFFKAVGLSSVSTGLRILLGLISTKVIAVYAGPPGIAMIGQLQNFLTLSSTIAQGGIGQGIVKYVAEYRNQPERRRSVLATSVWITLAFSLVVTLVTAAFAGFLAEELLGDRSKAYLFWLCAIVSMVQASANVVASALNGMMMITRLMAIGMISTIMAFSLTMVLAVLYHADGAVAAIVLSGAFGALLTFACTFGYRWMSVRDFQGPLDKADTGRLLQFTLMAVVSGVAGPVSLLFVRRHLVDTFSIEDAGLWQSIWRISEIYIQVVTIPLGTYYIPRLAAVKAYQDLRSVILRGMILIVPVTAALALAIYVSRDLIIHVLFSSAFTGVRDLFAFQLIGDFLKVASWLVSTIMVARSMTKLFIITDIVFNLTFLGLVIMMTQQFGLIGTSYAFALNYLLYLLTMLFIFRDLVLPRRWLARTPG